MHTVNTQCPECKGMMEEGRIADHVYGQIFSGKWTNSKPKMNIWSGRLKNEKVFELKAWRCKSCGFVKLFARD